MTLVVDLNPAGSLPIWLLKQANVLQGGQIYRLRRVFQEWIDDHKVNINDRELRKPGQQKKLLEVQASPVKDDLSNTRSTTGGAARQVTHESDESAP
jgi:hypothetical protein